MNRFYLLILLIFSPIIFAQSEATEESTETSNVKEQNLSQALKLLEEKKWAEALALVKKNLQLTVQEKTMHRQSLELYAHLNMQLAEYKEALRTYYILVKNTHQEGVLLIKGPQEMRRFLNNNPTLMRPPLAVLIYYQQMSMCYTLWAESVLVSNHDEAQEYFARAQKYLMFIDHFNYSNQQTGFIREKLAFLEKDFSIYSGKKVVEEKSTFQGRYLLSAGLVNYQEDVRMRFHRIQDLSLHSQVWGESFMASKAWFKDHFELNLNVGILNARAKVVSARSDVEYFHNHTEVFGLLAGPGALYRASQKANLGGKIYFFYRHTAYEDPAPDFHIEDPTEISALGVLEGRYDFGKIFFDHQLGYSPALGYALWMFQLGIIF